MGFGRETETEFGVPFYPFTMDFLPDFEDLLLFPEEAGFWGYGSDEPVFSFRDTREGFRAVAVSLSFSAI